MVEVKDSGHFHCNACIRGDKNCKDIRLGTQSMGTIITLCEDCRIKLIRLIDVDAYQNGFDEGYFIGLEDGAKTREARETIKSVGAIRFTEDELDDAKDKTVNKPNKYQIIFYNRFACEMQTFRTLANDKDDAVEAFNKVYPKESYKDCIEGIEEID